MPVLKQISPVVVPILPMAFPVNFVPSSRIRIAGFMRAVKVNYIFAKILTIQFKRRFELCGFHIVNKKNLLIVDAASK